MPTAAKNTGNRRAEFDLILQAAPGSAPSVPFRQPIGDAIDPLGLDEEVADEASHVAAHWPPDRFLEGALAE